MAGSKCRLFAFLPAFQKADPFSKSRKPPKKPTHFQKAGAKKPAPAFYIKYTYPNTLKVSPKSSTAFLILKVSIYVVRHITLDGTHFSHQRKRCHFTFCALLNTIIALSFSRLVHTF